MRLALVALVIVFGVSSGCGGRTPTAPEPPPPSPGGPTAPETRFTLGGRVQSTGGAGLASAEVEIVSGVNGGEKRTADGSGRYEFQALLPGLMTIRASASGHLPQTSSVTLSEAMAVDFTLPTPAEPPALRVSLSGSVCAAAPPPGSAPCLGGATVTVSSGPDQGKRAVTDVQGHYSIADLAPGDLTLSAQAAGFVDQARSVRLVSDGTVDFVLAVEPFVTKGRVVDILTQEGLADVGVAGEGITSVPSDATGAFRLSVPVRLTEPRLLIFSGPGVVERRTHARVPGEDLLVSLISRTFDLAGFDEMFRGPLLRRWVSAPRLVVERRLLQFVDVNASDAVALEAEMSEAETDSLVGDLTWALPQLTGSEFDAFADVTRRSSAEASRVTLLSGGVITVTRVEGLTAATGFWGYGRWQQMPDGTVTGGAIILDGAFEASGSPYRRSLRAHELGHALGYQHVTTRVSAMNASAREEPNGFDRGASRIAFLRQPGSRSPDIDPDMLTLNRTGPRVWSPPIR